MCKCDFDKFTNKFAKSQNSSVRDLVYVNRDNFVKGYNSNLQEGLFEHLLFAIFTDPAEFKHKFEIQGVGIDLSSKASKIETAKHLADLSKRAGDINGELQKPNGDKVYFNVIDTLKGMDISAEEALLTPIKFTNEQIKY